MDRYSGTRIFFIFSFPWITTIRAPYMLEANRRYGFWVSCKDPYTFILRYNIFYLCRTDCKVKVKTFGNSKIYRVSQRKVWLAASGAKLYVFYATLLYDILSILFWIFFGTPMTKKKSVKISYLTKSKVQKSNKEKLFFNGSSVFNWSL